MFNLAIPAEPRLPTADELRLFAQAYLRLAQAAIRQLQNRLPDVARAVPLSELGNSFLEEKHFLWLLYQKHVAHYEEVPDAAATSNCASCSRSAPVRAAPSP